MCRRVAPIQTSKGQENVNTDLFQIDLYCPFHIYTIALGNLMWNTSSLLGGTIGMKNCVWVVPPGPVNTLTENELYFLSLEIEM